MVSRAISISSSFGLPFSSRFCCLVLLGIQFVLNEYPPLFLSMLFLDLHALIISFIPSIIFFITDMPPNARFQTVHDNPNPEHSIPAQPAPSPRPISPPGPNHTILHNQVPKALRSLTNPGGNANVSSTPQTTPCSPIRYRTPFKTSLP